MGTQAKINHKCVERLCKYRQFLLGLQAVGARYVFSHQLAKVVGASPAQVRRDLMQLNLRGSSQHGYRIDSFLAEVENIIDSPLGTNAALVGIGYLGKAILSYFMKRSPNLSIVAAFDVDEEVVNRVVSGCRTYNVNEIAEQIRDREIKIGIITVPANVAQNVADILIDAGVHGIVNFAPRRIVVPDHIYIENIDITTAIEKTAYFSRNKENRRESYYGEY